MPIKVSSKLIGPKPHKHKGIKTRYYFIHLSSLSRNTLKVEAQPENFQASRIIDRQKIQQLKFGQGQRFLV